jgi:hypothetical protein
VLFSRFSEFSPFSASIVFITEPAEVYPFFLNGAVVEGAGGTHSVFAFASFASAFGFPVERGTQPAGKAADSDFYVTFFHDGLLLTGIWIWCLILGQFYSFGRFLPNCQIVKTLYCYLIIHATGENRF